jgi:NO-binding membrane sensor protein with MHYT domain
MIGVLIAVVAGIAGLVNFATANSLVVGIFASLLALLGVILYRGRRSRASYQRNGTRIFTLSFAICVISLVGNLAILLSHVIPAGN